MKLTSRLVRLEFDDHGAGYIYLTMFTKKGECARSHREGNVVLDYNEKGEVIGVEIIDEKIVP